MNLIFFGSSSFSTIVLEKLLTTKNLQLTTVVTTPDKPVGRHLKLSPNPVKLLAQKNNIPVVESLHDSSFIIPDSIGLVAAYGRIIKPEILNKFNGHLYNIHPSLLPKYRGPSPLQSQILDGISKTGVTIIQVDDQMDHGPIVAVAKDKILPDDTTQTLGNRLFSIGTQIFLDVIPSIVEGSLKLRPQNDKEATFTKKLTRQDGFVPYDQFKPELLDLKFRALHPWPGIWSTTPEGKRIKLISLKPKILTQLQDQKQPVVWQSP